VVAQDVARRFRQRTSACITSVTIAGNPRTDFKNEADTKPTDAAQRLFSTISR